MGRTLLYETRPSCIADNRYSTLRIGAVATSLERAVRPCAVHQTPAAATVIGCADDIVIVVVNNHLEDIA